MAGKPSKYDEIYAESRHALGDPFAELVDYFKAKSPVLQVLDLGAGQGRDALFVASLGHDVHAVDLSPTGLEQLHDDAFKLNKGQVICEVADLNEYSAHDTFDVILIDRSLHMLGVKNGVALLKRLRPALKPAGEIYIHDEKKDIPTYAKALNELGLIIIEQKAKFVIARAESMNVLVS